MWQDHFWGTNLYPPSPHMSFPFSLSCSQLGTAPTWASSPQGQLAVETTEVDNVAWHGGHRRRGGCALRQWPGEKRARETQKGPHFVVSENRGDLEIKPNKPQERTVGCCKEASSGRGGSHSQEDCCAPSTPGRKWEHGGCEEGLPKCNKCREFTWRLKGVHMRVCSCVIPDVLSRVPPQDLCVTLGIMVASKDFDFLSSQYDGIIVEIKLI